MIALEEWRSFIALSIPATLALVALLSPRRAGLAATAALCLSLLFTAGAALEQGAAMTLGVRIDAVTSVMLLLVAALGVVIVRYSRTYLQGDPAVLRYQRFLLLTLSAVTALVIANNLLVIALGWTATSLALHQLLTFYPDRTAALVAAHKKFLVSRLADVCLLLSLALVHHDVGSLNLDQIFAWTGSHPDLPGSMHAAAILVVLTAALKSAQLPFHGWLTQVMEAPTPVSALLHAGVVNIGGFVLIRLAPWMSRAQPALLLLVVIGLVSAVIAALVMTTRVSVKVALAWSTCAQMGFMLVQCGLGLWHLALLHLVAHSLYKAHAFLSTGTAVEGFRLQALTQRPPAPSRGRLGLATFVADGGTTAISVDDVDGVIVAGILVEAGATSSTLLIQVGPPGSSANHARTPTLLSDVFVRVGGSGVGKAIQSVVINSNNVVGDHLWLWRADHGRGVGWTSNTAENGLVVNGNDVTMYGLFVEHYQGYQVVWNGNGGRTYFFQNEMPYDVPDQGQWMSGTTRGFAAYQVAPSVTSHEAWGLGSYCFFNRNSSVVADRAFEAPINSSVRFHDMVTVSLGGGKGTIVHVINNAGPAATAGAVVQRFVGESPR